MALTTELLRDMADGNWPDSGFYDTIKEMARALLANRMVQSIQPYGYLRENDGRVQISIGPERPHERSGGYATPWAAIYSKPPAPACSKCKGRGTYHDIGAVGTVECECTSIDYCDKCLRGMSAPAVQDGDNG